MDTLSDLLDPPRSYLLEIPTECRLLIYRDVFADSELTMNLDSSTDRAVFADMILPTAVTQTCHMLRRESLPVLWSNTELVFMQDLEDPRQLQDAFGLQSQYGQNFLLNTRHVYLELADLPEQGYLTALPRLECLTIELVVTTTQLLQSFEGRGEYDRYFVGADDSVFSDLVMQDAMRCIPSDVLDCEQRVNRCQLLIDAMVDHFLDDWMKEYISLVSHVPLFHLGPSR